MRALVAGLGHMGGFHRKVLADLGLDVTTVDPDPRAGADYATTAPGRFDVVCVATPMRHLAEEAAKWAGFGGHLLIEKPGATSYADALELAGLLDGQRVAVGYVERFNPTVRVLRAKLAELRWSGIPIDAVFERHNTRPSADVALDLESHDRDLAAFLGLDCPSVFDARAGCRSVRRRIAVRVGRRWDAVLAADLTAHDASPLHAQWHAFLGDRPQCATLTDATRVLAALERQPEAMAA